MARENIFCVFILCQFSLLLGMRRNIKCPNVEFPRSQKVLHTTNSYEVRTAFVLSGIVCLYGSGLTKFIYDVGTLYFNCWHTEYSKGTLVSFVVK